MSNYIEEDLCFKDVFTETENGIDIEVNNAKVNCLTQVDNKFMIDSSGNLSVNSITSNEPINYEINYEEIFNLIYPVGAIYLSVTNVNPSTLFGGTWSEYGKGRTIVGVDTAQSEFNTVEKTGGSKTHTLTEAQMPSHNHDSSFKFSGGSGSSYSISWTNGYWQGPYDNALGSVTIKHRGGNQSHNNLQPYITCFMWKRTS